jgi:hypothetical protein
MQKPLPILSRGWEQAISFKAEYDQAGNLAYIKGNHGGEMYSADISSVSSEKTRTNLTTSETGSWSKHWDDFRQRTGGSESTQYNVDREVGARTMSNPETGKPMRVSGEWQYANVKGEDGKMHRELVGGTFQSGQHGDFLSFFKDDKGNMHYGTAKGTLDNKGKWVVERMDSISEKEFERNGFSVKQKTDSSGASLYSTAARGQNVKDEDKLEIDQRKELHRNLAASTFGAGDDLAQAPTGLQTGAMAAEEGVNRAADVINCREHSKVPKKRDRGLTLTAVDTRYSILVYGGLSEDTTGT